MPQSAISFMAIPRDMRSDSMVYGIQEWQDLVTTKPHSYFSWDRDYWAKDSGRAGLLYDTVLVSNVLCEPAPLNTPHWATHVVHLPGIPHFSLSQP